MKFFSKKGQLKSLLALIVCLGLCAPLAVPSFASTSRSSAQDTSAPSEKISSVAATMTPNGVVLRWTSNLELDNVGFNIFRVGGTERVRVNTEIIPGALFFTDTRTLPGAPRTYSWLDRQGKPNSVYEIQWIGTNPSTVAFKTAIAVKQSSSLEVEQTTASDAPFAGGSPSQKSFPAIEQFPAATTSGSLSDQWTIAAQSALKISVKRDGWYRVTQPEMVAAGFNQVVDIRDLRLFTGGKELAINTSQSIGAFGSGDYIEFYGQGLDLPTTDTRTYYLIAGNTPGKRVGGALHLDAGTPETPAPVTSHDAPTVPSRFALLWTFIDPAPSTYYPADVCKLFTPSHAPSQPRLRQREVKDDLSATTAATEPVIANAVVAPPISLPPAIRELKTPAPSLARASVPVNAKLASRKRTSTKKLRSRKQSARHFNHAETLNAIAPASFDTTVELKERLIYYPTPLNGDVENFFGRVIVNSAVNETLNTPNPLVAATGPAKLEVAMQGVSSANHQINVSLNSTPLGSITFFGQEHANQTFDVPLALLTNGANTLTLTPATTGVVSIVDYARITYPHAFRADADSLKFNLRGTQSLSVDGFSSPIVRLIDYTDPFAVSLTKLQGQAAAGGYAVTIPAGTPRKKDQRLLYAILPGQFQQAAALSLNQPSTINSGQLNQTVTTGADFLIIAHKSLTSAADALITARTNQGFRAAVVDIEDVYDEFSYGQRGPRGVRDFLAYAASHWAIQPRYIMFLGDASYDYRNYLNLGDFDLVPTKLVDATFNETASDDWLSDFDDDGVANIPVGRIPVRTLADANLVISKIVNFTPVTPEAAMLIADDPGTPPAWDFETASDDVQALLPASMTVQRVNVRTGGSTADIVNGFNQGRAVINYSGHGNVDVWSGSAVFTSNNALALTNGTKLPLVIVMDCLNGYFHEANGALVSLSEAFLRAPNGGAVAAFASSGLTSTPGQREMELELYRQLYGSQAIAVGDAIRVAKNATSDIDVKRTWIYFGDPSLKIR